MGLPRTSVLKEVNERKFGIVADFEELFGKSNDEGRPKSADKPPNPLGIGGLLPLDLGDVCESSEGISSPFSILERGSNSNTKLLWVTR